MVKDFNYNSTLQTFSQFNPMFTRVDIDEIKSREAEMPDKQRVFTTSSTIIAHHEVRIRKDDLFHCLRYYLRFGRLIGVVPFTGIFQNNLSRVKLRWTSLASVTNFFLVCLMSSSIAVGGYGLIRTKGNNALEWAHAIESFLYYSVGSFFFLYFIINGQLLIDFLHKWRRLEITYYDIDKDLFRDVNIISIFIFTSAILENATLHITYFQNGKSDTKGSLSHYYHSSHTHWSHYIPYHWTLGLLVFFSNKLALYAWNFVDILIIIISRAVYYKFKVLIKEAEKSLLLNNKDDPNDWKQVIKDHSSLCDLLQEIEKFLSPLVFMTFTINTYYVCLQLQIGLTESETKSILTRVYEFWSFVHLVVRIFSSCLSAARIHDYAHGIVALLYKCPETAECIEVQKTRHYISSSPQGLTGLGCFLITKPFILQLIGTVFTFEIVLLQAIPSNPAAANFTCPKT